MTDKIKLNPKYDLDGEYNPSDSDEYSEDEKRLLNKVRKTNQSDDDSEEEVYGFSESDSDKNQLNDSDVEGKGDNDNDDDLPDAKAWGKNKRSFYSTDYIDEDYGGFGKEEYAATQEEEEARILQNKLTQQLNDEDFSLDFFSSKKAEKIETKTVIQADLSTLSKRQKLQLFEKESPEFNKLVEDFKIKMTLITEELSLLLKLINESRTQDCEAAKFIKTMYDITLHYCTNIGYYIMLKAKKINIQNHPVIKRLFQYRQMINQMDTVYEKLIKNQVQDIISAWKTKNVNILVREKDAARDKPAKKLKLLDKHDRKKKPTSDESDEDTEMHDVEEEPENQNVERSVAENDVSYPEVEDGEKRAITYQMAKNKGLTPKRKKEQRNPRVKHRNKYRRAKIRRKGAIREVRKEIDRYSGEVSGIKTNIKKSIKIR